MLLHAISSLTEFFNYQIRKHKTSFDDEYLSILDRSICGKRHCTLRGFTGSIILSTSISQGKFLYANDIGPNRRCMTTPRSCLYRLLAPFDERSTTKLISRQSTSLSRASHSSKLEEFDSENLEQSQDKFTAFCPTWRESSRSGTLSASSNRPRISNLTRIFLISLIYSSSTIIRPINHQHNYNSAHDNYIWI